MQPFFRHPKPNNNELYVEADVAETSQISDLSIFVSSWKSQVDESFTDFLTFRSDALTGTDILTSSNVVLIPVS